MLITRKRSKDIAEILGISSHTVDTPSRKILKKTNCSTTQSLIFLHIDERRKGRWV
ncbi:MAG: hypothetical protein IAE67_06895 [Candidatus Competibacteraceae bacterium]|nr:hypothetical protein [Candidatus Competibacteraceae bacterium]